jgi:hypothetical protein
MSAHRVTALVFAVVLATTIVPSVAFAGPVQVAVVDDGTGGVVRPDVRGDLRVLVVSTRGFSRSNVVVERRAESGRVIESAMTDRSGFVTFRRGASERWYVVLRHDGDEVRRTGPGEPAAETTIQLAIGSDGYPVHWGCYGCSSRPPEHFFARRAVTTAWSPDAAVDGLAAPCEGALRGTVRGPGAVGCPKEPEPTPPRPEPPFVEITDAERLPPEPPSISPNQRP